MAKIVVFDPNNCESCDVCSVSRCSAIDRTSEGKPDVLDKDVCSNCGDCVADCKGKPKAFFKE